MRDPRASCPTQMDRSWARRLHCSAAMSAIRSFSASIAVSGLAGLAALLTASPARADRVIIVERTEGDYGDGYYYEPRHQLDIAVDGEGAVPLMDRRFQSGNDVAGGAGFKLRIGDQIRFRRMRITPEVGYGYDHLFATTDDGATSYAWDMHRVFTGARIGFGHFVVPTFYGHIGYGWRNTGDPSVNEASGVAFDVGFALDFHVVPHFGFGGYVEYATIDAQPYSPQWVALGLHADVAF
jgi:hypothetical protein